MPSQDLRIVISLPFLVLLFVLLWVLVFFCLVLRIKPRASDILGNFSATELHPHLPPRQPFGICDVPGETWSWKAVREFTTVFSVIDFKFPFLSYWDSDLIFTALDSSTVEKWQLARPLAPLPVTICSTVMGPRSSPLHPEAWYTMHAQWSCNAQGIPAPHWTQWRTLSQTQENPWSQEQEGREIEKWAVTGRCLRAKFLRSIKNYAFESMKAIPGAWVSKHILLSQRMRVLFSAPTSGDFQLELQFWEIWRSLLASIGTGPHVVHIYTCKFTHTK